MRVGFGQRHREYIRSISRRWLLRREISCSTGTGEFRRTASISLCPYQSIHLRNWKSQWQHSRQAGSLIHPPSRIQEILLFARIHLELLARSAIVVAVREITIEFIMINEIPLFTGLCICNSDAGVATELVLGHLLLDMLLGGLGED